MFVGEANDVRVDGWTLEYPDVIYCMDDWATVDIKSMNCSVISLEEDKEEEEEEKEDDDDEDNGVI